MSEEFGNSVELGLRLSERIYYGKDSSPVAVIPSMSRSLTATYLPTAVMVYAVVPEPEAVDNPDVPSYQPYVHGRCQPPALIPLHMLDVGMEVDCCLDHATISISGAWRVHCIMTSRRCDCSIAIPMGDKGSLLGVEVDITGRSYHTQLIKADGVDDKDKVSEGDNGRFLKGRIYTFKIPQVDGGSTLSIRATWSQQLVHHEGQFCLTVPFSFPAYVTPVGKKISKKEKILLNVNSGIGGEILSKCSSHALKELRRDAGKLGFVYEAEVSTWSNSDFNFSYTVFKKEVVFIVDTSGSMRGSPLENAKNALLGSLSELNPQDSFNIIAFNGETRLFSSSMALATEGAILNATQWLNSSLLADGGTNLLLPLKQAMKMLSDTSDSIPLIFLITDGAVDNERDICNIMKGYLNNEGRISPRICTFGIGSYCNHYFLQMLAFIGRGHYDSAYDADSVEFGIRRLFTVASSVILANISMDVSEHLESLELFPSHIPDLSSESPLILSGRYTGNLPESFKVNGTLADMSSFVLDLKVLKAKDLPLDRVFARRQIDVLTARAWLFESKELEEKIARMSIRSGVLSEYTQMILDQTFKGEKEPEPVLLQEAFKMINVLRKTDSTSQKMIFLRRLGVGFGNLAATAENIPPRTEESNKSSQAAELFINAATNCCHRLLDRVCCMCCIQTCSRMNNQCAIVLSQLCAALACFECFSCCFELCECL
ncbi:putative inter-alpha-trypsin inhibitor heavy chain [Tripterygium wilfordii]|uniref:Putative inter-alpha-trypsin inhibitor heavy chain n=1 Tax=Tripterygium wilfordii TaxID=458696 RepID=A0A7J7CD62_TRIWF|nr:putative inter-alpha-trypsin inhibitor heavy chain [Tripterygium wilfordii]